MSSTSAVTEWVKETDPRDLIIYAIFSVLAIKWSSVVFGTQPHPHPHFESVELETDYVP